MDILDLIGNTPLIKIPIPTSKGRVFAKLESNNPGGSVKDRPAKQMILDLLSSGKITKSTKLVEPTSGNTGIGLALVCSILKLDLTIILPHTLSIERRKLIQAYGAKLILVETGMKGAIELAQKLVSEQSYVQISQFDNPSNPASHFNTTGPEILAQCAQYSIKPAYFIAGVGSAGTITGVSAYLKQHYPSLKSIAVEPFESQVLSGNPPKPHKIQGISPGFIPKNYEKQDEIRSIRSENAVKMTQKLAKNGLLCGISTGANVAVAVEIAEEFGCDVVTVVCDGGERYLSVEGLFGGVEGEGSVE